MASVTATIVTPYISVDDLLGGKQVLPVIPRSPLDWVALIRRGIPSSAVDSLARFTRMTKAELASALGIPKRTLARRKREGKLNSEETAKLVRLARVIARAEEVFEEFGTAIDWLKSANPSLAGAPPVTLLDTDVGAESVMETLGRIEHGVFT